MNRKIKNNTTFYRYSKLSHSWGSTSGTHKELPRKPVIFSLQPHSPSTSLSLQRTRPSISAIEKEVAQRISEQKELLDNTRLPSFSIRRLAERGRRKSKEQEEGDSDVVKKEMRDLKAFWAKYLQAEQQLIVSKKEQQARDYSPPGLLNRRGHLNRSQQAKKTQQQCMPAALPSLELELTAEKPKPSQDRTTFFVNNFIKTRIKFRQKDAERRAHIVKEKVLKEEPFQNWVVPWQKVPETEEESFAS